MSFRIRGRRRQLWKQRPPNPTEPDRTQVGVRSVGPAPWGRARARERGAAHGEPPHDPLVRYAEYSSAVTWRPHVVWLPDSSATW